MTAFWQPEDLRVVDPRPTPEVPPEFVAAARAKVLARCGADAADVLAMLGVPA